MDWLGDTVTQFGHQMGIPGLKLRTDGGITLALEPDGLLGIETTGPEGDLQALVYLERPLGPAPGPAVRRALVTAHATHCGSYAVQLGLRRIGPDARLLALARIPERGFTLSTLSQVVDFLEQWLTEVLSKGATDA